MTKGDHWFHKSLHNLQITMKKKKENTTHQYSEITVMVCYVDQYFYQVATFDLFLKMHCLKSQAKFNPGIMFLIKILDGSTLVDYCDFEKYSCTVEEASQTPQQTNPYF